MAKSKTTRTEKAEMSPETEAPVPKTARVKSDVEKTPRSRKTVCPLSRERFIKEAGALVVLLDGKKMVLSPKEFATGSFGWFNNDKVTFEICGVSLKCQVNVNITAIGSKPD